MKNECGVLTTILRTVSAVAAATLSAMAFATPSITGISSSTSGAPTQGQVIKIIGSGFATKTKASPVLYDLGTAAYENGVLNTAYGSLMDGGFLNTISSPIWTATSSTAWGSSLVELTRTNSHRNKYVTGHYTFDGFNGSIGWPKAYGGTTTPAGNTKLFAAWWYKPAVDPSKYWRWTLSSATGSFVGRTSVGMLGESLKFSNGATGNVIHQDGGELHFILNGATSSAQMDGVTVTGLTSGAKAVLLKSNKYYPPGSNKYIRLWEEPTGMEGIRISWTQMHLTYATNQGADVPTWGAAPLKVGEWNRMEIYLDLDNGTVQTWTNNKIVHNVKVADLRQPSTTRSPSIALLGFNGKEQDYQRTEFGEIYMDSTPQRVVLGNASTWSAVTHAETQFITGWTDSEVTFKLNFGSLPESTQKYLYVFDSSNSANPQGYKICEDCKAPPAAPVLIVK